MDLLNWLFTAELAFGDNHILWREIIGNAFGLASAIGGMRRKVWAWPVGIVGNVLLFTVFFGVAFDNPQGQTLYGQAGRQIFFIAVSFYGWWRWRQTARSRATSVAVTPRWATGLERTALIVGGAVAVGICYVVFTAIGAGFPADWWYYVADSWIFVGSILATYAMARGWIEFWLCWIAVDLVGVPELLYFKFYPSAILYGIYGAFVIWGFFVWWRVYREEHRGPTPTDPVIETVGA